MKKYFGLVHTEDNRAIFSVAHRNKKDAWKCKSVKEWEGDSLFNSYTLLEKGIAVGIDVFWKPEQIESDYNNCYIGMSHNGPYTVTALRSETDHLKTMYKDNLLQMVPSVSFLTTIPYYLFDGGSNFVTIYFDKTRVHIGVTINKCLFVSYKFPRDNSFVLDKTIERIKKNWEQQNFPSFPKTQYFLKSDEDSVTAQRANDVNTRVFDTSSYSFEDIQSMGVALTNIADHVPVLISETVAAKRRGIRSLIYKLSITLIVISILSIAGVIGFDLYIKDKEEALKQEYLTLVAGNKKNRTMINKSNTLADRILRLENTLTTPTLWTEFLTMLGETKPKSLFIDKLTSQKHKKEKDKSHIKIIGWTNVQDDVTLLVSRLQEVNYLEDLEVISIQQIGKDKQVYGFNIQCSLKLKKQ